jgi:hypothetical protein
VTSPLVHPNSWNMRCIAQPGLSTVLGEVADFPATATAVVLVECGCTAAATIAAAVGDCPRTAAEHQF